MTIVATVCVGFKFGIFKFSYHGSDNTIIYISKINDEDMELKVAKDTDTVKNSNSNEESNNGTKWKKLYDDYTSLIVLSSTKDRSYVFTGAQMQNIKGGKKKIYHYIVYEKI